MTVLGLCFCTGFSLVVAGEGYSLVVVRGLLAEVASLVAEHRLESVLPSVVSAQGLSRGSRSLEHGLTG